MFGTVEVIPLEKLIGHDDIYGNQIWPSRLKPGIVKKICYRIYKDSSSVTYDINGGFKKYVNVEDCLSSSAIYRETLSFETAYQLKDTVMIEIAGLKRKAAVDSIEVNWMDDTCIVRYAVRDRTETVYYGVSEKLLEKWNEGYQ
ncbi:hypothetical protein [Bacillus sp. Marseille-Q1617]|uniref:hypothetical protein n=1 Tax=Bacillus sp. Marseille-Q1617 TaxID=2736887 RepID=UPI00158F07C1|nr:hypothetical protein [Bacillus sp. Marseille-Q1617]